MAHWEGAGRGDYDPSSQAVQRHPSVFGLCTAAQQLLTEPMSATRDDKLPRKELSVSGHRERAAVGSEHGITSRSTSKISFTPAANHLHIF